MEGDRCHNKEIMMMGNREQVALSLSNRFHRCRKLSRFNVSLGL
jgi:hypothetical protein